MWSDGTDHYGQILPLVRGKESNKFKCLQDMTLGLAYILVPSEPRANHSGGQNCYQ